jgi:hypothetical protein
VISCSALKRERKEEREYMRFMLSFRVPTEKANATINSGLRWY